MYQNSQSEEHLTPHRKHLNNADILPEKDWYSTTPEGLPRGIATTIKIQLRPHDRITPTQLILQRNLKIKSILNDVLIENNIHKTLVFLMDKNVDFA